MTQTTILREFQFLKDFRSIDWRSTLWFNLLRATLAGLVIAAIALSLDGVSGNKLLQALLIVPAMPMVYLILILPLSLLTSLLARVPFIGLVSLMLAIMVALGDPLICLLKRIWPASVPIDSPALFSLTPIVWVLHADEHVVAV